MKLYKHQQDLINKNPTRHLIAFDTGTGKTLTALMLAKKNKVKPLIICPKKVKKNWQKNLEELNIAGDVYTKEEFKKHLFGLKRYEAVIFDEAHYLGNLKSQLSKSFQAYIKNHNVKYIWLLTATPYLSTPLNIFALATHLGHDWNYFHFFNKFFYKIKLGRSHREIPKVKKNIEKDIAKLVSSIGTAVKMEDLFDVPEQTFETIYTDLSKEQKKAITSIQDKAMSFINEWTKTHQVENGLLYDKEQGTTKYFKNDKLDIIKDIVLENKKTAIFCRYTAQIDMLEKELSFIKKPIYRITGDIDQQTEAEQADECIVLINSACSEGYELPSIGQIVFASLSFSYKDYYQSKGRFLRANKLKRNSYIHLVADGVDKDVYNSIMKKKDFNLAIYNYERSKTNNDISQMVIE